jgi:hypothetical protein
MPDPKPTVGRIVHYYSYTRENQYDPKPVGAKGPFAGIITYVYDGEDEGQVALTAFPPPDDPLLVQIGRPQFVRYSEVDPPEPHTWRWPPRV